MMSDLQNQRTHRLFRRYGQWAVVTGASSGIGRELAIQLGEAGLNLVLAARSQEVLQQLADELIEKHGIAVRVVPADLAETTAVEELVAVTNALDVGLLVASAGFGTSGRFLDLTLADELNMLNVNCRALLLLSWHFGRRFAERGRGGLVLMSSIVGFQGVPNAAHYAATKAYVQTLAEALAVELKPHGVDVLAAAPGPTNSGFAQRADMQMGAALSPAAVARGTLQALGRTPTVLPGLLSKVLVYALALLPHMMRVRVMGRVMQGMTKHQEAGAVKLQVR
jgi:short-subunit dehydrogenase